MACYVEKGRLTVDGSVFNALAKVGVLATDQASAVIRNSTFTDCKTTALLVQNGSGIVVRGCTFDRIGGSAVSGIKATGVVLRDSKVSGCSRTAASAQGGARLTVLGNRITKCDWGVLARQVGDVLVQGNAITDAKPKGCGVQAVDSSHVRICDNRVAGVHSAIDVRGALKRPAAIARNTIVSAGNGAIFVRASGPEGRPAALIARNDCVGFGGWGIMLSRGSRGVLVRNTLVSATGMGLTVQRKSEAILNGNLIQTPEATVNIFESPGEKVWLRREILVGPDSPGAAKPRLMATARRITTALSFYENSERLRSAASALLKEKDGATPDGAGKLSEALSALYAARARVERAASELTPVRLLVEDRIGRQRPRGFSVYDGASSLLYGSPAFFSTSIKRPRRVALDVKEKKAGLSAYLRATSSAETQRLLKEYDGQAAPSPALIRALVKELNRLVTGPPIYDEERFKGVHLDAKTQGLVKRVAGMKKEDLEKRENRRLLDRHNRLLIEAVYGDWIAKSGKLAAATLAEGWVFLRPGTYWVVSAPDARYRRRVGVKAGGPVDVVAKSSAGLWLQFRQYERAPVVWHLFVPCSRARMHRVLSWLRRPREDFPSFSLHRPGASPEDIARARRLALKALPFAAGPWQKGDEPYVRGATRDYVRRILAIAGEPEDARRIIQSHKPHKTAVAEFIAKNGWACTIARLEARHGLLEKGSLVSLLKADDEIWALAAAIHLHKHGLTVGDDVLREYIRAPSLRYTTATPSHVLLDSGDPRTLDAMRALMRLMLARHREWVARHEEWKGKNKEWPTWVNSLENNTVPPVLYLLAHGNDADAKLVSSAELGWKHLYYLSFISRDPLYFAGVLADAGMTRSALRLGTGVLDRSPAESEAMYRKLAYRIGRRYAERVGRNRNPLYGNPITISLNTSNM
ncbi:MAG: right-handed parallel beta-helix repeat-containing protein, partial [Planctomycetota bacterium]